MKTAAGSADSAHNHAQQAEIDSLIAITDTANDSIGTATKAADAAASAAKAYREQVQNLGN